MNTIAQVQFTPKTQEIIDALSAIPKHEHRCDKIVIKQCFDQHFAVLGMAPLPIHWVTDAKAGYQYVRSAAESAARSAAWSAARSAAWSAAWSAAESAAWSAARSAAWFNVSDKPVVTKYAGIWLPFLKARDAGLWLYWVMDKEVVCCACPSIHVKDNRLHCEDGPAVSWPDSPNMFYYLKGVQITEDILNRRFDWKDIDAQANSEVRRIMMDQYGTERYIVDSGIKPVHSDDFGTLYRRDNPDGTVFLSVKVVNCTPEPDGTLKDYFIRANHKLYGGDAGRIAHAAVASTWRTKGGKLAFNDWREYCPLFET